MKTACNYFRTHSLKEREQQIWLAKTGGRLKDLGNFWFFQGNPEVLRMGRQPWSDRRTVEECRVLGIANLVKGRVFSQHAPNPYCDPDSHWFTLNEFAFTITYRPLPDRQIRSVYPTRPSLEEPRGTIDISHLVRNRWTHETPDVSQSVGIVSVVRLLKRGRGFSWTDRFFFRCSCGERVGKLYLPPGETYFACRACHNLTYRSCKEHVKRIDALRVARRTVPRSA